MHLMKAPTSPCQVFADQSVVGKLPSKALDNSFFVWLFFILDILDDGCSLVSWIFFYKLYLMLYHLALFSRLLRSTRMSYLLYKNIWRNLSSGGAKLWQLIDRYNAMSIHMMKLQAFELMFNLMNCSTILAHDLHGIIPIFWSNLSLIENPHIPSLACPCKLRFLVKNLLT
jgi:hypothetical protein